MIRSISNTFVLSSSAQMVWSGGLTSARCPILQIRMLIFTQVAAGHSEKFIFLGNTFQQLKLFTFIINVMKDYT